MLALLETSPTIELTKPMMAISKSLADFLPIDLFSRLQRHFDWTRYKMKEWMSQEQIKKGISADHIFNTITGNWHRKRPVWIMFIVNSLTEIDVKSRGKPVLDLFLAHQAERAGKMTGAVEKVEEQCLPLNLLNISQAIFALNRTLIKQEAIRDVLSPSVHSTSSIIQQYKCGNLDALVLNRDSTQVPSLVSSSLSSKDLEEARHIEDYFQQELIDIRNVRMAQRVSYLLQHYPHTSFFFAFGAGTTQL
ncbi:Metalloprotease TIKI1 [Bulinus truncatus]|nr:Metalloprotease TIKI1 [Bulinus truncatus]